MKIRFSANVLFCFAIVIALLCPAEANADPLASDSAPRGFLPGWTLWVPGGSWFYRGETGMGTVLAVSELSLVAGGLVLNSRLGGGEPTPYYNYPLLLGVQLYNLDKTDYLRTQLMRSREYVPALRFDTITFGQLMAAPFKSRNFFTSVNGAFVTLALAQVYLQGAASRRYFKDVRHYYILDKAAGKYSPVALYGGVSMAASVGAGAGEEYVFRNGLMPVMDYRYGQTRGLAYSSLIFGGAHLFNVFFDPSANIGAVLVQSAVASAAGWFLGRDVQQRGYDIGPAVAAHTWYDFTLMLGSFLVNPRENIFGVKVTFKM